MAVVADPPSASPWRTLPDGLEVRVRVTPRGGRDALDGIEMRADGRAVLRLRVRAVPEDGAATAAARAVLAAALGRPAAAVALTGGATSRVKTFRVAGDPAALAAALRGAAAESAP